MRGTADLSLAPLERRPNGGKQAQGNGRAADASPTRNPGHASPSGPRGGPFPPVPRPGTTASPYLLSSRRHGFSSLLTDPSRLGDGSGTQGALPRLETSGFGTTGGGGGAGTGSSGAGTGARNSPQHARGSVAQGAAQTKRSRRSGNDGGSPTAREAAAAARPLSPVTAPNPSPALTAAPALALAPGAAPGAITWAQVRDAQQHAWAESAGGMHRPQHHQLAAAPGGGGAASAAAALQPSPSLLLMQLPPPGQSSFTDVAAAWSEGATWPAGSNGVAPLAFPLTALSPTYFPRAGRSGLGGSLAGGNFVCFGGPGSPCIGPGGVGTDLAELERDLRDRERDLHTALARSSWSAGSPAPWAGPSMERGGSPLRTSGAINAAGGSGGGSAAAGLLAYEAMVGPLFSSTGLLEAPPAAALAGGMGSGGGGGGGVAAAAAAAAGMTPAQIQAVAQQQAQVHTLQRRTLMLRLPYAWTSLGVEMPAVAVQDGGGGGVSCSACLLVLPSDKPASRSEALAVETLLLEMLRDPEMAAARAAAWRADVLGSLCSESIACFHEASKLRQGPGAAAGGGGGSGGGAGAVVAGSAASGAGEGGGGKWQLRGLDGVELSAPAILGPFTTLLQPSLQAHTAAIEAQRAGLASAHARRPASGSRLHGNGGGGGGGGLGAEASSSAAPDRGRSGRRLRGPGSDDNPLGRSSHSLTSPYSTASLTVGVCVGLADLIRQVEVHCCERGRALASAWNTFMVAHQDSVDSLRRRTAGLQREVEQLTVQLAERRDFTREIEMLEFLKRENARFKRRETELLAKGLLTLQANPGARDGSRLVVKPGGALGEAVEAELASRLARLRWQHAWHTFRTQTRRVAFQSTLAMQPPPPPSARLTAGGPEAEVMVAKLALLQRLTLAVERAEKRRQAAEARRKAAEEAAAAGHRPYRRGGGGSRGPLGLAGSSPAELAAAVAAAGPGMGAKLLEGLDPEDTANLLAALSVEAQVVLLASLQELRRAEVLAAMTDADRAQVVVIMSSGMRAHTARVLGRGMWLATIRSVKDNPQLGARLLSGMEQQEAVEELSGWSLSEQQDVFAALDLPTAARLMAPLPSELRQKLLTSMQPHLAANIIAAMLSSPAAASLDELDYQRVVAILMAMDPAAAANLLQEMGSGKAAEALLGMDSVEVRHCILESMAPRVAAETLLEMDSRASIKLPDDIDVEGLSFVVEGAGLPPMGPFTFPGTEALGEMPPAAADKIMGYMGVQDKAATLSRMDPERAAELLAMLSPDESVALLACLSNAAQAVVVEALKQEERDSMMKVLASASGLKHRGRNAKGSKGRKVPPAAKHPANAKQPQQAQTQTQTMSQAAQAGAGAGGLHGTPLQQLQGFTQQLNPMVSGTAAAAGAGTAASAGASLSPRVSAAAPAGGGGGGGSGGGGGVAAAGATPARTGPYYNTELAVSINAVVNRRARDFIDEYSDGEGPYDERGGGDWAVGAGADRATPERGTYGGVDAEDDVFGEEEEATSDDGLGGGLNGGARAASARYEGRRAARATDSDATAGGGSAQPYRPSDMNLATSNPPGHAAAPAMRSSGGGTPRRGTPRTEAPPGSPNRGSPYGRFSSSPPTGRFGGGGGSGSGGGFRYTNTTGDGGDGGHPTGARGAPYGSIRTAFRINRQQQLAQAAGAMPGAAGGGGAHGGQAAAGMGVSDIGQLLRMAGSGAGSPGKQLALGQLLMGVFREGGPAPQMAIAPKNARLANAILTHPNARPRPKGWLMGVVESVYKDGEALLRKMGLMEALRRQSIPDIVFMYFANKYGQRSMVDEYAACLANTLARHRAEDLRLEVFARFLSEQWDFATFFDFLTASSLAVQPAKVLCIEYPREAGRDELYPWLCTHKAVTIADAVLGPRSAALRDRFNEVLLAVSVPADDTDVDKLQRDPRYAAAAADAASGSGPPLPERFYRLPRPRFLAILSAEVTRLNAAIGRMARGRFESLDAVGSDSVPASAVPGYLCGVVAPKTAPASNFVVQEAAQRFIDDALSYQLDSTGTAGATADGSGGAAASDPDVQLSLDAWVAASVHCPLLRDHFKLHVLRPRRLDVDAADGGGFNDGGEGVLGGFLMGLTRRHTRLMVARMRDGVGGGGDVSLVTELAAAVDKAISGGDKFRAYAQLLLAIIKHQVAAAVALLVGDKGAANDAAGGEVEEALCRLEDCALIMLKQTKYLMQCSSSELQTDLIRRLPPQRRIFVVGRELITLRQHRLTAEHMAALVVQAMWRRHRRRKRAAEAAAQAAAAQVQGQGQEGSARGSVSGSVRGSVSGALGLAAAARVSVGGAQALGAGGRDRRSTAGG